MTVGGAIAADIHGKNHHVDGTLREPRRARSRCTRPKGAFDGRRPSTTPSCSGPPRAAWASPASSPRPPSGCIPIETSLHRVDTERATDLDDVMARMVEGDDALPLLGRVDRLPRHRRARSAASVLTRGDHAPLDALPPRSATRPAALRAAGARLRRAAVGAERAAQPADRPRLQRAVVPQGAARTGGPPRVDQRVLPPARRRARLEPHLRQPRLRAVPVRGARRRRPTPSGARSSALERRAQCASFLAVLKRFGPGEPGPAVVPRAGLDARARHPGRPSAASAPLLDDLDELVVDAGGRVYLAKDSRLDPSCSPRCTPSSTASASCASRVDPDGVLQSDLARRLASSDRS